MYRWSLKCPYVPFFLELNFIAVQKKVPPSSGWAQPGSVDQTLRIQLLMGSFSHVRLREEYSKNKANPCLHQAWSMGSWTHCVLRKLLGFGILSKTTPDLLILIYYFQGKNVISKTSTVFFIVIYSL